MMPPQFIPPAKLISVQNSLYIEIREKIVEDTFQYLCQRKSNNSLPLPYITNMAMSFLASSSPDRLGRFLPPSLSSLANRNLIYYFTVILIG